MRIKLIFSDEFKIQNCWFGLDTEKILTVGDLIKDLSTACGVGSISLEMDGFLLLDDGEISVLLRDGDLLIVQSSGKNLNKKRKRPIEEISTDRSLAVNIRPDLDSADDTSSIDEQNNNLTLVQGNPKNQNSESKSSKTIVSNRFSILRLLISFSPMLFISLYSGVSFLFVYGKKELIMPKTTIILQT